MDKENVQDRASSRFNQILAILKKYDVIHGLTPKKLKGILEECGPTFVKLGQIMSMRSDLLPEEYCQELDLLRSQVMPISFSEVQQVFLKEYGTDYKEKFSFIAENPIGSASIAQVHPASLIDQTQVVVKVQRPGIQEEMAQDIQMLQKAIHLLKYVHQPLIEPVDFKRMVDEMWAVAQQEMNFLIEANHLEEFAKLNNGKYTNVTCPKIFRSLTTSKLLVMEYVDGIFLDDVERLQETYDLEEISYQLAENYAKQILTDGFFHADPHTGNICIRDGKIVWIDLGMVGRLSLRDRELFIAAIQAILGKDSLGLKNVVTSLGIMRKKINHSLLYEDVDQMLAKYGSLDFASMNLADIFQDLTQIMNQHQIGIPEGMSILFRGLVTIQGVLRGINPKINFMQIIKGYLNENPGMFIDKDFKGKIIQSLFQIKKLKEMPMDLANLIQMTAKGQTKINMEITGSEEPLSKIEEMVNRGIIALLAAALIIGSSMIATTDMSGKIFGIPLLGTLGYISSIIMGGWVCYGIIRKKK